MPDIFSQEPYRCRLDWGFHGTARAASRGDIIILVDTLSFSTTVTHAVSQGAVVFPCGEGDDARELAKTAGAEIAVGRRQIPAQGRYSLSPATFSGIPAGTKVVLPSLNGGNCCRLAAHAPFVFVATLINAAATATAVAAHMNESDWSVTVIACGEREPSDTPPGDLRMAIEDCLGAGAILATLPFSASPEARICINAFLGAQDALPQLLWESVSGRELRDLGFGSDVKFASRLNSHTTVPILRDGHLRPHAPGQ
jgi:2-phosphosulfolactate phosphatase